MISYGETSQNLECKMCLCAHKFYQIFRKTQTCLFHKNDFFGTQKTKKQENNNPKFCIFELNTRL